jgi:hypothetical protein
MDDLVKSYNIELILFVKKQSFHWFLVKEKKSISLIYFFDNKHTGETSSLITILKFRTFLHLKNVY